MTERHPLSERFHDLLTEVGAMHDAKQADYGSEYDPFANVRNSTAFGVPGWGGCAIRMNDKMVRLQKAVSDTLNVGKPNLRNEGIKDTFLDLAVYSLIGYILYEDWEDEQELQYQQQMRDIEALLNQPALVDELKEGVKGLGVPEWLDVDTDADKRHGLTAILPLHTVPSVVPLFRDFDELD